MTVERIDHELCNGCGTCVTSCTMDVIRLDTVVAERNEYSPCRRVCPAGIDIRRVIQLYRDGALDDAMAVLREASPLTAITGRVCPHFCEAECARKDVDEAVNIRSMERYVTDFWMHEKATPSRRIYAAKVAVAGSGPAGLTAAYYLAKMGYPVTVFESHPVLGGMLRIGIPEYRLPRDILDTQLQYIRDTGVEFEANITIGKDKTIDGLRQEGYGAIFMATGAQVSRKLDIEGSKLDGVMGGLDFLRDHNLKKAVKVKDRVVVIGGGNVAIDVALTALRLGAKDVQLVCLESNEEMPAFKEEIQQAVDEGIGINVSWGPKRILGKGNRVTGVELIRCTSVYDRKGMFTPQYDESSSKHMEADMVIVAIGQAADLSLVPGAIKTTATGVIQVDPVTQETTLEGVFASGDVAMVNGTVVEAIASGRRAAESIDRYLRGEDIRAGRGERPHVVINPPGLRQPEQAREEAVLLPVKQRQGNFDEVNTGFNADMARLEGWRCMTCGSRAIITYPLECMTCDSCELDCPQDAIYVNPERHEPLMVGWR
jgi:NADPH-dependent glutamate synthase beta subunit-like oxidoreductase/NAD-dependent dihydropyrimidine dehydrogenase PreA subunit